MDFLVWVGKTRNTLCIGKCCRDCVSHNVVQEFNGSRCQIKICFAFQTKPIEHLTIPSLRVIAVSVLRTPVLKQDFKKITLTSKFRLKTLAKKFKDKYSSHQNV